MTNDIENILKQSALTSEQSKVYLLLLRTGILSARRISINTGIGRAMTYKVLDQLAEKGLVEEKMTGKIALFSPLHPEKIKEIVLIKKEESEKAYSEIEKIYGSLASSFNLLQSKPNVQFFEGIEGLQRVYDDILDVNQNIMVISSPVDETRHNNLQIIREQITKQKAQNIRTRAITPIGIQIELATPVHADNENLITRKIVPADKLKIPAQIIIYQDKVAITNFKESIITVLIESKYINETFRIMFEYIWNHG